MNQIGSALRNLRLHEGDLLYDMAKKMNLKASDVSRLENGSRSLTENIILKLTDAYNLSADEVLELRQLSNYPKKEVDFHRRSRLSSEGLPDDPAELLKKFNRGGN